jgi:hypothetical protein
MKRRLLLIATSLVPLLILAACGESAKPTDDPKIKAEVEAREAFARRMLLAEDAGRALGLSSTKDIQFDEGFSMITYFPPDHFRDHAVRWMGQNAHIRLHGHPGKSMKLHIGGWANTDVLRTRPFLVLFIDGERLGQIGPVPPEFQGHFWFDIVVPPEKLTREWVDLNIKANCVAFHWADPPTLQVLQMYNFEWTEVP